MKRWILLLLLSPLGASAEEPRAVLETSSRVPIEQDKCLDHAVRELGMSAKRAKDERVWAIQPQFLHPSVVPGGTIRVQVDQGEVRMTASWPGAAKAPEIQREIESRLRAMAAKMAQICGVVAPEVKCTFAAEARLPSTPCP